LFTSFKVPKPSADIRSATRTLCFATTIGKVRTYGYFARYHSAAKQATDFSQSSVPCANTNTIFPNAAAIASTRLFGGFGAVTPTLFQQTQCHNSNSDSESPTTTEALEWGFDDQPKMAPHANQFSPLEVENASRQHIAVIISHPKTCNIAAPLSMHITAPHEICYREDIN